MSLGTVAQVGATGAGGFFGGPAGAAAANAAVGGLRGDDFGKVAFNAGLAAGATGIGESLFGGEELAGASGFTETAKAGFPLGPDAVMTPVLPNAGRSVGSFDVLGVPTAKTLIPTTAPSTFDTIQKRAGQANTIGTSVALGQQLFQPPPRQPLRPVSSGPFQPVVATPPPAVSQFTPQSLFRGRRLFG